MRIKKKIIGFIFCAISFLLVWPVYADRIILKGGNFIEGKIIEDDSTGVLLAIGQKNKGSSATKISRAQIASLEINTDESKTPFDSLEDKNKIFKRNSLVSDSTIFLDPKYGFYLEVYPSYYLNRRDVVRQEALFSSPNGEALMIEVFPCKAKDKKIFLSSYGKPIGVTPGMDKRSYWQGMDVYLKISHEFRSKTKIKMIRSSYLLFPKNRDDFGVNLIFVCPESLGAGKALRNANIINTACVQPVGPAGLWERFKNIFKKGN